MFNTQIQESVVLIPAAANNRNVLCLLCVMSGPGKRGGRRTLVNVTYVSEELRFMLRLYVKLEQREILSTPCAPAQLSFTSNAATCRERL